MSNIEIETDFLAEIGHSNVFSAHNQVVSKKTKKRSSPKRRLIFRPKSLGLRWWGGGVMHPEMETDFSAEIVSFRLVGGMHPPIPPKSATGYRTSGRGTIANQIKKDKTMSINKHVDDHNITGIAQVSIRDRFRPCSRDSSFRLMSPLNKDETGRGCSPVQFL